MDEVAAHTGRHYRVAEYTGHPEADRVVVVMGSGGETVRETVTHLVGGGERVGVLQLRLYRPFPAASCSPRCPRACARWPCSTAPRSPAPTASRSTSTSSPPSPRPTSAATGPRIPRVIGGRYGLSSKELTPAMVAGIFTELALPAPRRRFTIGITDDVGGTSLPYDDTLDIEEPDTLRAVFYGLGSDGTVGANKNTIKILGADPDVHAQAYFVYDSKKSGGLTVSHLRFGPHPIHAPVPGQPGRVRRLPPPRPARHGRRARLRRGRRDPAAQRPPARRRGVGRPARPGAAAGDRQAAARVRRRRRRRGPRRRPARPHQHRAADLLLRDLRGAARRRGGRCASRRRSARPTAVAGRRWCAATRPPSTPPSPRCTRCRYRGPHVGARDARHRAQRRARVRAHRDRRDDGRPRRRPPGQRDAGRRHLPERHHRLREAPDLRRRRRLGPGRLHPVRHLQLRVPAQRHPVQVLRRRGARRARPRASGRHRSTPPACPARATPCRSTSRTAPAAACASRRAR